MWITQFNENGILLHSLLSIFARVYKDLEAV